MLPLDKQNQYRRLYQRISPGYRDSGSIYDDMFAAYLTPESRVLDAGCDRSELIRPHRHNAKIAVEEKFLYVGDPSYLAFNQLFFKLGVLAERITDHSWLVPLKVHLVAAYVKA